MGAVQGHVDLTDLDAWGKRVPYDADIVEISRDTARCSFATGVSFELEVRIVLDELRRRVARFEPAGEPARTGTNVTNGLKRLPVAVQPA